VEGVDELGLLGAVLEGQYRIDRLAAGSAALLGYQGHDVARDLPVFVKIVRPIAGLTIGAAPAALTTLFERLHAEGAAAHHLGSDTPHVRRVLSAGTFPAPALGGAHVSYRIGEALRGPSLLDDLASQGRRDAATALALLDPVVLALQAGEARGFVHGEVSPRAIVLEPSLEPQQMGLAKLDDGGLARTLTVFGWEHGLGSLEGRTFDALFAAPEYFRDGQVAFSPLTDIHGLALTLLTLLLGRPPRTLPTTRSLAGVPYTPGTLGAMGVAIDDAFATVLCRALSPDPTERPQTLTSFWEALRLALSLSGAANGFTAKGTKVLPNASPLPVRAGTIPMAKRDAPVAIVESASAVGAKHDPFKIDPFAQTFGADAARPGVSPLASTVPPGKGPSQAEVLRAGALFVANGPGVGPAYAPPPVAAVPPLTPAGGSVAPPALAPEPSAPSTPALADPRLAAPTLRSPDSSDGSDEGTPVWIWIILPIAGLAILALLAFIVALVFGWDPKFL
jgi:hypothetical protein